MTDQIDIHEYELGQAIEAMHRQIEVARAAAAHAGVPVSTILDGLCRHLAIEIVELCKHRGDLGFLAPYEFGFLGPQCRPHYERVTGLLKMTVDRMLDPDAPHRPYIPEVREATLIAIDGGKPAGAD